MENLAKDGDDRTSELQHNIPITEPLQSSWNLPEPERKQAEAALQQAKEQLEIRVEHRTAELKVANALLREEIIDRRRVEAQLRESEERFRSIFNQAAVGIAQLLLSGQYFVVNQKFADIVGYTEEELQQKTFQEITHPDDISENLVNYRQIWAGEIETYSMEKRYIRKNGFPVWVNLTVSLLRCGNAGEPKYFINIVEDISGRKRAQQELRENEARLQKIIANLFESEARLHTIVANLFDGLLIVDRFSKVRFANPAAGKLFNCQPEDLIGQEFGLPIAVSNTVELGIIRSRGEISIGEMSVVPVQWEGESVYVVSLRDITERKRAEEALRESEERFRQLAENVQDVFWLLSPEGKEILYVSPAYEQIWGRPCEQLYADRQSWIDSIEPEDRETVLAKMSALGTEKSTSVEYRIVQPDGSIRWIWDRSFPIKDEFGKVYRTAGIAEDITDRKLAEAQIKASLQEKEILLKEVHHRVKNNMQVISSLLELQSQSLNDALAIDLFRESQNRISSMALIHEQLYQSEHLDRIDLVEYIQSLVANLLQSFGCTNNTIHLNLNVAPIYLNIETAIPCGLIINEVLSNSLKYAFPQGSKGEVSIQFIQLASKEFNLSISDNGIGLPPNFNLETTETLGLRLVRILTRQLKGVLEIDSHQGTTFKITFAELNYRRRF
ncbi:PAS domain S-box protein [Argonema antarcticum]|uniref:PAS domain S-box protein n=1 Tax=Argonema antarcticum TaxID=2942763 RepID=UPI0020131682|nr:PAS domain S-box protein [Argonema antarcticum]MCL1470539.1 PAS domain S-box protein [Argonema antarcticum A004/B2]